MYFESFQQLVFMGGHGVYVWSSVYISLVVLGGLILKPLCQKKQMFKNIQVQIDLQKANDKALNRGQDNASHS